MLRFAPILRAAFLFAAAALAGCATPGRHPSPGVEPNPHYKVGQSYEVNGRRYHPREQPDYEAVGIASWYGQEFHGRLTANGELFDRNRMTAAHPTLPLPSRVEVENLENGRKILVRVNDRGPFKGDRIIDLSQAAARALGFEEKGLAPVRVRYVGRASLADATVSLDDGRGERRRLARAGEAGRRAPPAPASGPQEDVIARLIAEAGTAPPAPTVEYWIDVARFADLNALEAARLALSAWGPVRVLSEARLNGVMAWRVQVGPYADEAAAAMRLAELRGAGYASASLARERAAIIRTCEARSEPECL
ncbi:septal ring lytic transglycosylase RlpA family protein [Amphiplicatus metriothermophilus]|uniref:Endolytic peptidoglycan transglycosylase RlpA n=1 Tax=Amphiplicatus metriothermophilus TaxID=1519374 RepID=A0A239PQJ3_9PROT|nr:septal ring lytic transglycosylase RlpA family protein [Amphiplicatus metriothermophilus]MBB5518630.1 rare lipoprotein A [Amphiplicatus metriothermophilus]SNT72212.1 rare lipoprotein A [Amphiplicatus metriothermophilus]